MMKQIGIMGGTFDPPHMGHLWIAEYVQKALALKEIRFIPTGMIAYKDNSQIAKAEDRLEMVRLAIMGNPNFVVDDIETQREGITYTFETLELLKAREPDAQFTFIVGADSLDYMERWMHPERIFACCRVAAVVRKGFPKLRMLKKKRELARRFGAQIEFVKTPVIPISSTEIRQRLSGGRSIHSLVPEAVEEYISQQGLYR